MEEAFQIIKIRPIDIVLPEGKSPTGYECSVALDDTLIDTVFPIHAVITEETALKLYVKSGGQTVEFELAVNGGVVGAILVPVQTFITPIDQADGRNLCYRWFNFSDTADGIRLLVAYSMGCIIPDHNEEELLQLREVVQVLNQELAAANEKARVLQDSIDVVRETCEAKKKKELETAAAQTTEFAKKFIAEQGKTLDLQNKLEKSESDRRQLERQMKSQESSVQPGDTQKFGDLESQLQVKQAENAELSGQVQALSEQLKANENQGSAKAEPDLEKTEMAVQIQLLTEKLKVMEESVADKAVIEQQLQASQAETKQLQQQVSKLEAASKTQQSKSQKEAQQTKAQPAVKETPSVPTASARQPVPRKEESKSSGLALPETKTRSSIESLVNPKATATRKEEVKRRPADTAATPKARVQTDRGLQRSNTTQDLTRRPAAAAPAAHALSMPSGASKRTPADLLQKLTAERPPKVQFNKLSGTAYQFGSMKVGLLVSADQLVVKYGDESLSYEEFLAKYEESQEEHKTDRMKKTLSMDSIPTPTTAPSAKPKRELKPVARSKPRVGAAQTPKAAASTGLKGFAPVLRRK